MEVAPPGFGKATLMSYMAKQAFDNGGTVLMWVHKKELVFNLRNRLKKQFGISAGLIMSGQKEDRLKRIQIGSVATMVRRDLSWLNPTLVMGDESHRLLTGSQLKLYDEFVCDLEGRGVPALFFTATPVRLDKKRKFSDYCDHLLQLSTYRQEMNDKNLVPTRVIIPDGAASLEGVKIRMRFGENDFDDKELSDRFSENRIVKALYARWKQYTGGQMQTMIFNVDKTHNKIVCDYFREMGVAAEYVDESTPQAIRDELVERFQAGPFVENPIMVLCNIMLFCEGLDAEWVKCVVLNYATKSFSRYIQSTARGSRPVWEDGYTEWKKINGRTYKKELLVLDFGGNTLRHGKLEDYDMFGFDLDSGKKKGVAPTKQCPECREVVYASVMTCPNCQYDFPPPEQKDDKKYADEVEMRELNNEKSLQKMIIGMSQEKRWKAHPGYLRVIALTCGYQAQWVFHAVKEQGRLPDGLGEEGTPDFWKNFWRWIQGQEKEKGMLNTYKNMAARAIKK